SARHAAGMSLIEPEPGDHLLRVARDGTLPGTNPIPVALDNLPESTEMVQRGRARLAGPLVGFETPEPAGRPGEILHRLLEEEHVTVADFRLPKAPEVSSRGSYRPVTVPVPPVAFRPSEPSAGPRTGEGAWFVFSLPKGAYATVLLREFTKLGAVALDDPAHSDRAF
ncbi:MAG: tRNA pseudouridine(13) synthase TruD, partial [Thermoplasmata archaeon]|nr:tRNA pseudouridine(13) synthase TruD [Thermoplasmata archaeon]